MEDQIRSCAALQAAQVITSQCVIRDGKPILFAARPIEDDTWVLLDAAAIEAEDQLTVTLAEIIRRDPTIQALFDLPLGWQARRRSPAEPWIRYPRCC